MLHKILPNKVDPLVSLMKVEKVPDSTYEMFLLSRLRRSKRLLSSQLSILNWMPHSCYSPPDPISADVRSSWYREDSRLTWSELVQKFIRKDSRMVRELFVMSMEYSPGIIIMDEIKSSATL